MSCATGLRPTTARMVPSGEKRAVKGSAGTFARTRALGAGVVQIRTVPLTSPIRTYGNPGLGAATAVIIPAWPSRRLVILVSMLYTYVVRLLIATRFVSALSTARRH